MNVFNKWYSPHRNINPRVKVRSKGKIAGIATDVTVRKKLSRTANVFKEWTLLIVVIKI